VRAPDPEKCFQAEQWDGALHLFSTAFSHEWFVEIAHPKNGYRDSNVASSQAPLWQFDFFTSDYEKTVVRAGSEIRRGERV